ncbi:MAG: 23S rRNA (uracil(1939)-C(5))-methyltransferase RlmD [Acidobacteria bacterium]|nr:23S rRNA (uracil(1939)-C(5))-methyltransferase RlmD [Acidobacteriota bacterium]
MDRAHHEPAPRGAAAPDQPLRPGTVIELPIEDLTSEGDGVGRHGGWVVFVPGAVPGDRAAVQVRRLRRRHVEARLVRLVVPSRQRREPPCPHQPACGGCPLMVLDEGAALSLKVRHLEETLRRIGRVALPVERAVASPRGLEYRGRVTFAVVPRGSGGTFGYHPRGRFDSIVPVERCRLAPPRASEIARSLLDALDRGTARQRDVPWPERLSLRGSLATERWLAVLHTRAGAWPEAHAIAADALRAHGDLAGVVRLVEEGFEPEAVLLAGQDSVVERIAGIEVELGATTFLQVNPATAELLYDEVRALLERPGPGRLLDLFCGVGLVGLVASGPGQRVLGIESHAATAERGRRAAHRAGRDDVQFVVGDALLKSRELLARGERFDRVVANPPRAGLGPGLPPVLRDLGAEVLVVISCHPATLARDLVSLRDAGFEPDIASAFDMFPQTPHLEAVVRLCRA